MKVYIVIWTGAFEEWRIEKVFSKREKADEYIKGKEYAYMIFEEEVQ